MAKKKTKPAKAPKPARNADDDGVPKPKLRRIREADSEPIIPKSGSDIFTGLAALSLIALIGSAVFFHLDAEETALKSLAAPSVTVPSAAVVSDLPRGKN